MIEFRLNEFFLVAAYLRPVLELESESNRDLYIKRIVGARCSLSTFTSDLIDAHMPASKRRAEQLMSDIDDVVFHRQVHDIPNLQTLQDAIRKFETVLAEEVSASPIFCLERVGNLSTERLLSGATTGYDAGVVSALDEMCIREINEAGKCLAFERATAAGFHILRAVELSVRQYLTTIPGFNMPPLNRQNWGEFIALLRNNGASKDIVDALQNIKDNYRNPLMHPNDSLEMKQSISLFSVCQGMIELLIDEMQSRMGTTKGTVP